LFVPGVQDPNVIDVVAHDPIDDVYLLVMVEDRPWDAVPDQSVQLRNKINTYAGFVLDGALQRQYPEALGHRVRLQLDCSSEPTAEIAEIVRHANHKLFGFDLEVVVRVRN
jgi:hypothetical protein